MSRLVVVSNRLPTPRSWGPTGQAEEPEIPVGGLASALLAALRQRPESVWFGWSGRVTALERSHRMTSNKIADVDLLGLGLTQREFSDYYLGFCNEALWPLFHCFPDKARVRVDQEACYRAVQARFAAALLPHLRPDDMVWVHDYHLLLVATELRRAGWRGRIGFFLHTPFPPYELWQILPDPQGFLRAMLDYDVVGFQVRGFLDNYAYCCARWLGAAWDGARLRACGRTQHAGPYPVGIEPEWFQPPGDTPRRRRHRGELARVVSGRRLILGVDRLDYTKGIPERILALEEFLQRHPEWRRKVSFMQIAAPSRAGLPQYAQQKSLVESLVGRVNGELAEHDWEPVRYLYRSYSRDVLARFYREADVGLVTPLRDGMNLVAKEFVAAQDTAAPGVLVLSRCAGVAEDLPEAITVNPFVAADVAAGIERALVMPLEERRERQSALLRRVLRATAADWSRRFVEDLAGAQQACAAPDAKRGVEPMEARALRPHAAMPADRAQSLKQ